MADGVAVLDASPLILLSRASQLDLLRGLRPRLVVPEAVLDEVRQKGAEDVAVVNVARAAWLETVPTPAIPAAVAGWDLGRGESSVLAWALSTTGSVAVLDDLAARRCAQSLGVPLLGTAGVVLLAKGRGLIPAVRPVFERLVDAGMYLSDALLGEILRRAGE